MNAQNIRWYVSKETDGYPSGGFFTLVLDVIFDPLQNPDARLRALSEIFNRADTGNSRHLDQVFPGVRPLLVALYHDDGKRAKTLYLLARTLEVLPFLLLRLPGVYEAVSEYSGLRELEQIITDVTSQE